MFSEPYWPHANIPYDAPPTGLLASWRSRGGILVTTQAQYIVSGAHPTQMSQQLLPGRAGRVVFHGDEPHRGAAVFASNDGLVSVYGGNRR